MDKTELKFLSEVSVFVLTITGFISAFSFQTLPFIAGVSVVVLIWSATGYVAWLRRGIK